MGCAQIAIYRLAFDAFPLTPAVHRLPFCRLTFDKLGRLGEVLLWNFDHQTPTLDCWIHQLKSEVPNVDQTYLIPPNLGRTSVLPNWLYSRAHRASLIFWISFVVLISTSALFLPHFHTFIGKVPFCLLKTLKRKQPHNLEISRDFLLESAWWKSQQAERIRTLKGLQWFRLEVWNFKFQSETRSEKGGTAYHSPQSHDCCPIARPGCR